MFFKNFNNGHGASPAKFSSGIQTHADINRILVINFFLANIALSDIHTVIIPPPKPVSNLHFFQILSRVTLFHFHYFFWRTFRDNLTSLFASFGT